MKSKKIIILNWRTKPESLKECKKLLSWIPSFSDTNSSIVIFPPTVFISEIKKMVSYNKRIFLGAQNFFGIEKDDLTGQSPLSLFKGLGVKYVFVGHKDLRGKGETNEIINKKIKLSLKYGFKTIFCVGEKERDSGGLFFRQVREELVSGLVSVKKDLFKDLIISYEPKWSVGKESKGFLSSREISEMVLFIRKVLSEICGRKIALEAKIIYGGSVNEKNIEDILNNGCVTGVDIGRVSLLPDKLKKILSIIEKI